MDELFTGQLVIILAIIGGVIAILNYLKKGSDKEKDNAVKIAEISKDLRAQEIANMNLKEQMMSEITHVHKTLDSIIIAQGVSVKTQNDMLLSQASMAGDIKSILKNIHDDRN